MQRALLLLLVAASYALLAGGRPWTLGPLVALAFLAAAASPRRTTHFPANHRTLDLSLVALLIGIALQLVPLPTSMVRALSPMSVELWSAFHFTTMSPPAWMPLSIRPEQTLGALAAVAIGVLSFWTARATFSAPGNTRTFCRILALIGMIVAIAAVIQKAATPKLLLFSVVPEARSTNPFGAFTNRNHLAAWLLLISTPVIGYLIARLRIHDVQERGIRGAIKRFAGSGAVLTAMSAVTTIGVLLMTLSRSAVVGLGVAALVGWRFGRPRMRFESTTLPTRLGLIGVIVILTMVFIDLDAWAVRVEETFAADSNFGRVTIWKETLPIIRDFWLTGTGAGTYSDAMNYYQQTRVYVNSMQRWAHFNNAHSHFLQAAAEGGLLLLIPALVALSSLWTLGRRTLRADKGEMYWVRVGAAAGLAAVVAQSVFEVAVTMPANAVLCGVLGGLLLYRREERV